MNAGASRTADSTARTIRTFALVLSCLLLVPATATAATLFSDDFEDGNLAPWTIVQGNANRAGVNADTAQSGSQSMFLRWDTVATLSPTIDTSGPAATLDLWIRRGDDSFSEDPDNNEDLTLAYIDDTGNPVVLETFPGAGPQGEVFTRSYSLPADARHANFQVGLQLAQGSGSDFDYWHVDDVVVSTPTTVSANLLAEYRMDEGAWDGTAGEVTDSSGNGRDGTAQGGATTAGASPAIPGDPGTCRYGGFDGSDDYVQVANLSNTLNGTATLTFWIRTTQTGNDIGWQAPGVSGVEESGGADDIFWGWIDGSGRIGISVGNDYAADQKSTTSINDGNWHHVALTRDAGSGATEVYVDGALETSGTSGTGIIGNAFASIGRIEDTGGSPEYFQGELDEVRVYDAVLSGGEVQTVFNDTHPCAGGGAFAWYRLDEASYDGTPGEVIDSSGNGNAGNTVGRVDNEDPAEVCAGAAPRGNNNVGRFDAIDTGVDIDADLGNQGSINFHYRSDRDWDRARDQMLFDASTTTNNRYFYLSLHSAQNNQGAILTFGLEDSSDGDHEVNTARLDFPRDTWVHIGVTWDLVGEELQIFVNGGLQASNGFNGTGQIAGLDTLYIGDNRSSYIVNDMNGRAAEGGFDEVRLYGQVIGAAQMASDRDATHPCPGAGPDHYSISHSGTAVTCGEEAVTISAHNPGHQPLDPGTPTLTLTTSTGEGTWARVLAGSGTLSDPTAGDGQASYSFPGGESSVTLAFNYTTVSVATDPETVSLNAQDGSGVSELSGNADASDDPDLLVSRSEFRITDGSGNPVSVPEQIAGKPSDVAPGAVTLALQAVRASDSDPSVCEPFFPGGGDVDVELGGECSDPSSCAGRSLAVTNNGNTTAVATSDDNGGTGAAGYTAVTLRFGPNAEAPLVLEYDDAGEIQLHARHNPIDDGSGTPPVVNYVVGASNPYVVRPFGFEVSVAGDDSTTGAGGTVLAVAGDNVDTTVRAVLWQAGDDSDDDGVPDSGADLSDNGATPNFGSEAAPETVTLAPTVAAPAGGIDGNLSAAVFSSFSAGAETHGVSWDEVGHVHIDAALTDGSYLGGSDASGRADTVGRFIPADFDVTVALPGDLEATCSARFTYTDQPFAYATEPVLDITARNRAGGTTLNYTGTYAKLVATGVAASGPTQDRDEIGLEANPVAVTSSLDTGTLTDPTPGDGMLTYMFADTDSFAYDKVNNARINPFEPHLDLEVTDVDDGEASADPAILPVTVQPGATHQVRFGRLAVDGAIGSELAPIDQAVRAEYWLNDTWQTHTDDDCTTLALAGEVQLENDQGGPVNGTQPLPVGGGSTDLTTNTADPVALAAGRAVLTFAASGDGNTGFAETTLTLAANRPWLRHDWDDADGAGDGPYDDLPSGRVTFGIHAGNPNWIHFRRTQ